ncbi:adenine-specific methyltransferase EcoRI family protein, partial [Lactobacillus amylovorus]
MTKNISLRKAKEAKNDEFYTPWDPIEKEINSYLEFNPDVFRGKTILLPADDPFESNFFKFFALHFKEYGLKKLIATSYDGSPIVNTQLSLFDDESEQTNRFYRAYKIELEDVEDINHDGVFNLDDVEAL